jgi:hypothetical protein
MIFGVFMKANPAKLKPTVSACHMIASLMLFMNLPSFFWIFTLQLGHFLMQNKDVSCSNSFIAASSQFWLGCHLPLQT